MACLVLLQNVQRAKLFPTGPTMVWPFPHVTPDMANVGGSVDELSRAILTNQGRFSAVTTQVSVQILFNSTPFRAIHTSKMTNTVMPDLVIFQAGKLEEPLPAHCTAEFQSVLKVIMNHFQVSYQGLLRPAYCIAVNTYNWLLCLVYCLNVSLQIPDKWKSHVTEFTR